MAELTTRTQRIGSKFPQKPGVVEQESKVSSFQVCHVFSVRKWRFFLQSLEPCEVITSGGFCIVRQIDVVLVLDSEGLHAALCKMWLGIACALFV